MTTDRDRLEASFRRNYRDVAAYCRRRCTTVEDAEDAATEVFAVAWRRVRDLPAAPDDRLWLFGVARHVVANQARARRRAERLQQRLRHERAPAPPGERPDVTPVQRALAALPDADRELLLLTCWEGLTPAQIARVLGRPAPVVSTRLWRARRRFAHVYQAATRDPEGSRPSTTLPQGAAR